MKSIRTYLTIVCPFCVLLVLCSCNKNNPKTAFRFSGAQSTISETADTVYIYSYTSSDEKFIGSYDKSGKKHWENKMEVSGDVYPLKDGRFFFANREGQVYAYDKNGNKLWEKKIDITTTSNSNYLLNSDEELMVNVTSSPNNSTEYLLINISGDTRKFSQIKAPSTYTCNYPKGGYIIEGFIDYNWSVSKISADFIVEWIYHAKENEQNISICDISEDGNILLSGTKESGSFLKQLDEKGKVMNDADFKASNVDAKYFKDHIIAVADKITLLNHRLSVMKEAEAVLFPSIKICGDSAFIYSSGSYNSLFYTPAVTFDGYLKEFDVDLNLRSEKTFKQTDHFIGISNDGVAYYKK